MDLDKWLRSQKVEDIGFFNKEFAKKLGISHPYLCNIKSGRCRPSYDLAMKIEKVTGGEVSAWDILNYKPFEG